MTALRISHWAEAGDMEPDAPAFLPLPLERQSGIVSTCIC